MYYNLRFAILAAFHYYSSVGGQQSQPQTGKARHMATAKDAQAAVSWDDSAEEFDGGNRKEKAELVGQPFMMTHLSFGRATSGYANVTVTALTKTNERFTFMDGSTGVYAQLVRHLASKGTLPTDVTKPDTGEYPVKLIAKDGLVAHAYESPVDGRPIQTYYLP
jgi:hypothetical protein